MSPIHPPSASNAIYNTGRIVLDSILMMPIESDKKCPKCSSTLVYFVQHAHGNYPIMDLLCPKCDLGGMDGESAWGISEELPEYREDKKESP